MLAVGMISGGSGLVSFQHRREQQEVEKDSNRAKKKAADIRNMITEDYRVVPDEHVSWSLLGSADELLCVLIDDGRARICAMSTDLIVVFVFFFCCMLVSTSQTYCTYILFSVIFAIILLLFFIDCVDNNVIIIMSIMIVTLILIALEFFPPQKIREKGN